MGSTKWKHVGGRKKKIDLYREQRSIGRLRFKELQSGR